MKEIRQLLSFLHPFIKEVCLSILIGIATIAAGIGMMGTSAFLIASAALHPSIADLQVAIVGVRFFGISRGVFRYFERLVSHSVNLKVLARLRVWFYERIERIAPAGLQNDRSGELLNRVMADLEVLENFYVRVVSPIVVAAVITIGMSLILCGYAVEIGCILAAGMLLNGLVLPVLSILLTQKRGRRIQESRARLSAEMLETFQGLEELQAADAEGRWLAKIKSASDQLGREQQFYGLLSGMNEALTFLVMNLTLAVILFIAIPLVKIGTLTGVSLAVISLLTLASFEASNPLPQAAQNLTASVESARRLFALAENTPDNVDHFPTLSDSAVQNAHKIEIQDLNFTYDADAGEVLSHIQLTLEKGKSIALVGPSGAGKSSLVNVLMRFWNFEGGKILLDGKDLRSYSEESTRRLFSVISQNSSLFANTLKENLLLAKPQASDAELIEALQKADLIHWFDSLPQGLNTWMGERGAYISGGEAQRLAVARAILQDAPFVLLDEPTAHLDQETASRVLTNLLDCFSDKGLLLITHRFSGLEGMDEIVFLSSGKVVERGTYPQLLAEPGAFACFLKLEKDQIPDSFA